MSFSIKHLQKQLKSVWRLFWVPAPNFGTRLAAIFESIRLSNMYQKLRTPFWLQKELIRLIPTVSVQEGSVLPTESVPPVDESVIEKYLSALKIALLVHPSAACLEISIRILQILHAKGVYSDGVHLKIGMRRTSVGLWGHAWVEYGGEPLLNLPVLGQREGSLNRPILDVQNLRSSACKYEALFDGQALIEASTLGVLGGYEIKSGLIVKQLRSEAAVILDIVDGNCFILDSIGYDVWKALARSRTLDASIRHISERSGVDVERVKADIEELLCQFVDAGLIKENP